MKLQAKDLRVGNMVFLKSKSKVCTIDSGYEIDMGTDSEDFEPIQLTEDWLRRGGFETIEVEEDSLRVKNGIGLEKNLSSGRYIEVFIGKEVNYVHQLQNLYFALTGEEIEFKAP